MRKLIILLAALTALAAVPAAAAAPPSQQRQINQLRGQATAQQGSIRQLQGQVGTLTEGLTQTRQFVITVNDKDTCTTAITIDMIVIIGNYLFDGGLTGIDDQGACARIGITRSGRTLSSLGGTTDRLAALRSEIEHAAPVRFHHSR
jgi:hypothetical protein